MTEKASLTFLGPKEKVMDLIELAISLGFRNTGVGVYEPPVRVETKPAPGTGPDAPETTPSAGQETVLECLKQSRGEPVSRADIVLYFVRAGGHHKSVDYHLKTLIGGEKITKADRGFYCFVNPKANATPSDHVLKNGGFGVGQTGT